MSKVKKASTPRKTPAQARSRATVDAIIQASTYILIEAGWKGFTTNAIAERAGVNISSLYQFFKNKEAIVEELQRRLANEGRIDVYEVLKNLSGKPTLRETLSIIVEIVIKQHRIAPSVHKILAEEVPRTALNVLDEEVELRELLLNTLRPLMVNIPDPELAINLVGITTTSIINQITISSPDLLNEERFITEVVTLLERYLVRSN